MANLRRRFATPILALMLTLTLAGVLLVSGGHARAAAVAPTAHPARHIWRPAPHSTWQWQLTGRLDQSLKAQIYDIDLFDNSASVVASLHRRGRHVICYLDAGTYENFRPDRGRFPPSVLGNTNGWPGERWLDIRRLSILEPIMRTRFALCRAKGFDGVEADNVDGYENGTGFPLTGGEQLTYNRWLARTAHSFGLSIAIKNDVDQAGALQPYFDYALDEQCFQYSECGKLHPFVAAHKAVFEVEYDLQTSNFCGRANADGFMSMRKGINLGAGRQACWQPGR